MRHVVFDAPEVEYIAGRAYPKVSPKRTHSAVQGAMIAVLRRTGGEVGFSGPEWRFHLAADISLVPDVAFVSYERLRPLSDEDAEEPPFAPDIAVEVRSPSHRAALLHEKIKQYFTHGARLVLDIDPQKREMYAHTRHIVRTFRAGDEFTCAEFSWLKFEIAELFATIEIPR